MNVAFRSILRIKTMIITVLDYNEDRSWLLGKVSLWSYLLGLSPDDFDYDIQRGIVINPYLDSILTTIVEKSTLPPFSLVASEIVINDVEAEMNGFSILDGLQRTYRLWLYKKIAEMALERQTNNYQNVTSRLKELFPNFSKIISPRQIRSLFNQESSINVWNLRQIFENCFIYLYIWRNLTEQQAVKKMLLLNAGQKRMPIAHQYELMYLHVFRDFQYEIDGVQLYRSKDERANEVKRGNREVGEYVIPSIIIGLQSFIAGTPMRLSGDMLYSATSQEKEFITESSTDLFFNRDFILRFVTSFNHLDRRACRQNDEIKAWMSKDGTIAGLMGGIGAVVRETYPDDYSFAEHGCERFEDLIAAIPENNPFNLEQYEQEYGRLQSARINIGMILRKAITHYTKNLVTGKKANWKESFMAAQNKMKDREWYD